MGKLIKNHWARLIILTAASYQLLATLTAFFWPKLLFDTLTKTLDACVKPYPILQTLNLVLALLTLAYEYPLKLFAGTAVHGSFEARMLWLPLCSLACLLMYQGTNAGIICAVPWTLPKRSERRLVPVEKV
ncbi:hypothetical protein B0A50_00699 [Salinomyces thailandicus]|uniref:DUF7727 domain-containing protein n=1 Tax=Salinomyces thailandicus TaxID=706561 RepID=A0A4U0UEW8_9PEZI|nr:hypothetical protein B0A50_00699 [Salinomyces thailandica]